MVRPLADHRNGALRQGRSKYRCHGYRMTDPFQEHIERQARTAIHAGQSSHSDPMVRQRMGELMGGSPVSAPSSESSEGDGLSFFVLLFGWPLLIAPVKVFEALSAAHATPATCWVASIAALLAEVAAVLLIARITPWWLFGLLGMVWGGGMIYSMASTFQPDQAWLIGLSVVGGILGLLSFVVLSGKIRG